ncbi:sodium:solute symporter family protein [Chloroflexus aggregans]|uniref:Na+/solute symporter n=1 Tax=Chloroflexus aggregans (strain MD-66 / DSM 9485) TaxID=326427 RepID=B8G927_CHLAD|nr:sodium:solute symporter family protein [Chloroflexus aggregans]ACL26302.1 Na+/solute symporter [Chloroflexus aggregans DSM 9485]
MATSAQSQSVFRNRMARYYGYFTIGFIGISLLMLLLEVFAGLPTQIIGWVFLLLTMALYATIGILSRTKLLDEYYVAGRNVPAVFNGMATGADWMSAASFISMAGTLWLLGYDGLAYIMGWTGGYVLLALLFAPYLRKFGQYTIPDFVGARFGGNTARVVAAICAIIVSLTYVTAQVVGVGLIMQRFVGVDYTIGVILGLSGVLVCSFLGGMKAVTWTQVAQYIILIIAYLIPVTALSIQLTGFPIPQLSYGQALQRIQVLEQEQGLAKTAESPVVPGKFVTSGYIPPFNEGLSNAAAVDAVKQLNTQFGLNVTPPALQTIPDAKKPELGDWRGTPWNFLALMACLMLGTAGLPHILIRFYTVPSVRESRMSVGWSLFFIFLLYFTAPAYAAFSRWQILENVVGKPISELPNWTKTWASNGLIVIRDLKAIDGVEIGKEPGWVKNLINAKSLVVEDANGNGKIDLGPWEDIGEGKGRAGEISGTVVTKARTDGILQLNELGRTTADGIDGDLVVLSTPDIAGLPFTIGALIAAGGLAAALSTADGLLVVIASAIAHDIYFRTINPKASLNTRIVLGKSMIVVAAVVAALLAMPRLALIAQMVAWAFSMAAATFFPVVLLGIFWKRANGPGAIAGMIGGLAVTLFYMFNNYTNPAFNVLGISHLGSGIFGLPVAIILIVVVSLLTKEPSKEIQDLVDNLRNPITDDEGMSKMLDKVATAK